MGLFGKKEIESIECPHVKGLPSVNAGRLCKIFIDGDSLKVSIADGGVVKIKWGKTFTIPIKNVISFDVVSQKEIAQKSKSVIGRGIAGGLIFGPVGAIIGGMSGIGAKEQKNTQYFVNIAFYDSNDQMHVIIFKDITALRSMNFAEKFTKQYLDKNLDTNDAGEIVL